MTERAIDNVKIVQTEDGTATLFDCERELHYSSTFGARAESLHVFVEGSKLTRRPLPWRVLELGFGGAVNFVNTGRAWLEQVEGASSEAQDGPLLEYHSVEKKPVDPSLIDFHDGPFGDMAREALESLRVSDEASPAEVVGLDGRVRLCVHPCDWSALLVPNYRADAIFYDPFGPSKDKESWTDACFRTARRHLAEHGLLATYSAAGHVKRRLFEAGFSVASAPGPGPKRQITFAALDPAQLEGYERLNRDSYLRT